MSLLEDHLFLLTNTITSTKINVPSDEFDINDYITYIPPYSTPPF